eukprot:15409815-Alexandrium_andersonii.AAC.1
MDVAPVRFVRESSLFEAHAHGTFGESRESIAHSRPSTSDDSATRPHNAREVYARLSDEVERNGE